MEQQTEFPSSASTTGEQRLQKNLARRFTVFKDLPFEIRLRIWWFTFPRGRIVNVKLSHTLQILDDHLYVCHLCDGYRSSQDTDSKDSLCGTQTCQEQRKARNVLPVTMKINRESRAETRKYYIVLFPGVTFQPLYFNPGLDIVNFMSRIHNTFGKFYELIAVAALASHTESNIDKIQYLQIDGVYWDKELKLYLSGDMDAFNENYSMTAGGVVLDPTIGGLRSFCNLKELILSRGTFLAEPWVDDVNETEQEVAKAIICYFSKEKETSPECKIPEITWNSSV